MKKLQKIKNTKNVEYSKLAGIAWKDSNYIGVNIQLLWDYTKKDTKFIPLFSEYYTHEWLHLYLKGIGSDYGEELVIRRLLGQRFNKKEREFYKQFYK
jgi:hypothetical protein